MFLVDATNIGGKAPNPTVAIRWDKTRSNGFPAFPHLSCEAVYLICLNARPRLLSSAVCSFGAHCLLARGPFVQFVGQIVRHLKGEARSFASGRDLHAWPWLTKAACRPASSRIVI
jgi:hypothetical protein